MVNENEKSLISTRQKTTKVSFIKMDTLYIGGNQYKGIRFNGTDFIIFFCTPPTPSEMHEESVLWNHFLFNQKKIC